MEFLKEDDKVEVKTDSYVKETRRFTLDGVTHFASYWRPLSDDAAKCLVVLVHGYGEYLSFAYDEFGAALASDCGAIVFGHDHVGHGRSSGERVQVKTGLVDLVDPVLRHVEHVKGQHPGLPCFIVGHSLGGLVSLHCLFREQKLFNGFVGIGPLVSLDPDMATPLKKFLAKAFHSLVPSFTLGQLETELVTRDPEMVRKIKEDDLEWKGGFRAKMSWAIIQGCDVAHNNIPNLTLPIIVFQGEKDKLVLPQAAKDLVEMASSEDKRYVEYPDAFHHLFIELPDVKVDCIDKIKSWINERI